MFTKGVFIKVSQDLGNQNHTGEYSILELITVLGLKGKGEKSFQSLEKGSHNKSSRLQWSDTATQRSSDVTLPSTSDLLLGFSIAKPKCKLRRARELIDEVPTGQPPQAESRTERDKTGYRGNKERYVVET